MRDTIIMETIMRKIIRSSNFAASALLLASVAVTAGAAQPSANRLPHFDPINFSNSTQIDNQWYPLVPGTQFIYEGSAVRGSGLRPHRVVFTVTDLTKVINGVRTVVMWDRDFNNGKLVEAELAFHAQDNAGNVWNLGEYPEEYERGKFAGASSTWIAGVGSTRAGILIRAHTNPRVGTPSYAQGWSPDILFSDRARVFKIDQEVCVPFNCYEDVLVTDEFSVLEPGDGHQRKFYAPGVGTVLITAAGGKDLETLELIKIVQLSPEQLANAREKALKLDERAYRISPELYGDTSPAEYSPLAPGLRLRAGDVSSLLAEPELDLLDDSSELDSLGIDTLTAGRAVFQPMRHSLIPLGAIPEPSAAMMASLGMLLVVLLTMRDPRRRIVKLQP